MQQHKQDIQGGIIDAQHTTEKRQYEAPTVTPISVNSGTEGKAATIVEVSINSGTGS